MPSTSTCEGSEVSSAAVVAAVHSAKLGNWCPIKRTHSGASVGSVGLGSTVASPMPSPGGLGLA